VCRIDGPVTARRLAEIEPLALADAGHQTLVLAEAVGLGTDDELDVCFVRLLREALAATVAVDWTAGSLGDLDESLVCHLQPPRGGAPREESGAVWRDRYRFGRCYYRLGPGFVLIKDTRDSVGHGARYRLDGPDAVAAFPDLERALHLPAATARARELFELLAGERLALRRGDWGTVLPFRMRRWPVPFSAV
jgi:hypothetical protein